MVHSGKVDPEVFFTYPRIKSRNDIKTNLYSISITSFLVHKRCFFANKTCVLVFITYL